VELVRPLVGQLIPKFLSETEMNLLFRQTILEQSTLMWSAKEAVFKWYGEGGIDFRDHIRLLKQNAGTETLDCFFTKTATALTLHYRYFDRLVLAWVMS
jgi:hypothetical protein